MKPFLIAFAFVGANAMACPDAVKDASVPATEKPLAAFMKAKPAASPRVATKAVTKVAAKPTTDVRKATTL